MTTWRYGNSQVSISKGIKKSTTNGNLTVDDTEIQVYDDNQVKQDISNHEMLLESHETEIVNARGGQTALKSRLDNTDLSISQNTQLLTTITNGYVNASDYAALQNAIDDASTKGKNVNLNGKTINLSTFITIPSNVKVYNGTINFTDYACVQLSGESPCLENVIINMNTFVSINYGAITLINTNNAYIHNVTVNNGMGLFCKSKATNTNIKGFVVQGNLYYGILFNDAVSEQGTGYRIVNGVDYSTASLGYGLTIEDYTYNNTSADNNSYYGDGIEINCPDWGFSNIQIINATVTNPAHKNVAGSASGMGLGFARCKNVIIDVVSIKGASFDALHFENSCNTVLVSNFLVDSSCIGIKLAGQTSKVIFNNGIVTNCTQWMIQTDSSGSNPISNIDVTNVTFDSNTTNTAFQSTTIKGINLSGANQLRFKNIRCVNFGVNDAPIYLGLSQYNAALNDVYDSVFDEIFFIKGSVDITYFLLVLGNKSTNCVIRNVKKVGYTNDQGYSFNTANKNAFALGLTTGGLSQFSGDGTTTSFVINHNLGFIPKFVTVTPGSSNTGTAGISFVTRDSNNINIFMKTAPIAGTNNVSFHWGAYA